MKKLSEEIRKDADYVALNLKRGMACLLDEVLLRKRADRAAALEEENALLEKTIEIMDENEVGISPVVAYGLAKIAREEADE